MKAVRCKGCHNLMDAPTYDGTPYEGLYACYNCDLYNEGSYWAPFERADALVERHENDPEFRVKPHMARLNVS
jgi:hypothetical protein